MINIRLSVGKARRVNLSSQSLLSCDTAPQVFVSFYKFLFCYFLCYCVIVIANHSYPVTLLHRCFKNVDILVVVVVVIGIVSVFYTVTLLQIYICNLLYFSQTLPFLLFPKHILPRDSVLDCFDCCCYCQCYCY